MSTLYTIGHSTRTIEEFTELLETYGITHVVDVRTIPKSRRYPWFGQGPLATVLDSKQIHYSHLKDLGGMRHAQPDSIF